MAVYDLEEQEKLDDLKAWWQQWGNTITTICRVACVALAGVRAGAGGAASRRRGVRRFFRTPQAARATIWRRPRTPTARSRTGIARTGYAPRGALVLAKLLFDSGDTAGARAQLQWVIDRADETELKEIARYRLAELLLNDKQYDEALKVLDAKHGDPFAGLYADLRGDALARPDAPPMPARVSIGARENRREVAVPQLCPGKARRAGGAEAPPANPAAAAAPAAAADRRRAHATGRTDAPHARAGLPRRRTAARAPDRARRQPKRNERNATHAARVRSSRPASRSSCVALAGCATIYEYLPVPPAFSLRWLWRQQEARPAAGVEGVGHGERELAGRGRQRRCPAFAPTVLADAITAPPPTARSRASIRDGRTVCADQRLSRAIRGRGRADASIGVVRGHRQGRSPRVRHQRRSEMDGQGSTEISRPRASEGIVAIFAGDGSVHALSATDGSKKWVNQRVRPPLTVRNFAGAGAEPRALFVGTAAGACSRFDISTGSSAGSATVAKSEGRHRARGASPT
jgi:predicted negative regulator of RcsB-dependent stress response